MPLPFKGRNRVTSIYEPTSGRNHKAIDIVGDDNKTVYAVSDGVVGISTIVTNKANKTWEWGNYVRVDLSNGTHQYYCHLASRVVKAGQQVKAGDTIGVMGNTGYSQGAHLHFETRTASNVSFDPAPTLGIPNVLGTYARNSNTPDILTGEEDMKMGIYAPNQSKSVSSQLLKEGAIALKNADGLVLYDRRMAKEVQDDTLSSVFEQLKGEMLDGEIIAVTDK